MNTYSNIDVNMNLIVTFEGLFISHLVGFWPCYKSILGLDINCSCYLISRSVRFACCMIFIIATIT